MLFIAKSMFISPEMMLVSFKMFSIFSPLSSIVSKLSFHY